MAVVALVGVPGSPGVTTTALALLRTWPLAPGHKMLLAECCPDGGAVLPGALQGRLPADRGLRNLSVSSRTKELVSAFWTQLVALSDDTGKTAERNRLLLPGLTDFSEAAGLNTVWPHLAQLFAGIEPHQHDVLVDLGRNGAFGPAGVIAMKADLVLLVVRGTIRSINAAQHRVNRLKTMLDSDQGRGSGALGVIMIEEGPYGTNVSGRRDVEEALGVRVVATLPYRPKEAAVLSDGVSEDRNFARSKLMNAAREASGPIARALGNRRARAASPLSQRLARAAEVGHAR
ncbi:hypothetical protein [Streptomyces sp. N35]|uniref:hypothetical protein n=1 Tax=Streptomyces sp. N35 TaxID=2795730 RepID=UPI0018F69AAB|nr:hypothetical protein [Streptomyces sp. N35]